MQPIIAQRVRQRVDGDTTAEREPATLAAPTLPNHLLFVLAGFSACVTAQGGYYAGGFAITGLLLTGALSSAHRAQSLSADDLRLGPVLALTALAGWTIVVAIAVGGDALPLLGTLACLAAVLVVLRRTTAADRNGLAIVLTVLGAAVALSGWVGVAWRVSPLTLEDQELWRAATTLTYANAAAGLLAPLCLLSVALQLANRRRSLIGPAVTCLVLTGLVATMSRAGALSLVVGLAVMAALTGLRPALRALMPALSGAVVALVGLAPSMSIASGPRPSLAIAALVAGVGLAVALNRASALVLATVAVVVLFAATMAAIGPFAGHGRSITDARLTPDSSDRRNETLAAVRLVAQAPLTGTGPGEATLFFAGRDGELLTARYVHNEYLQALTELGAVGLVLVIILMGAIARSVRRGRASQSSPYVWAGAAAGLAALAVHSAFDFLWHVPAVPLLGALLVGLTFRSASTQAKEQP